MAGISNFHTHTYLCGHAEGWVPDYVQVAQSAGCTALGFSDHCPYPESDSKFWQGGGDQSARQLNTWPEIRMTEAETEDYVKAVREAATTVDFPIYLGFECEYDKRLYSWYKDELLGRWGADYLVFGPHWVAGGQDLPYIPVVTSKQELRRYFAGVVDGIASGLFAFVAHPDLVMASGRQWDADIEAGLKDVLQAAIDCKLPVEINGLGLARANQVGKAGQLYPYNRFWELVAASGATVICNSDAHQSENTIAHAQLARDYGAQFGLVPIETIF